MGPASDLGGSFGAALPLSCSAGTPSVHPAPQLLPPSPSKARLACCVPGCTHTLPHAYNRKHRICRQHQRAASFAVPGMEGTAEWRFCSQCARPEPLECFEGDRRSCRVSSERHRQRRRAEAAERQQRAEQQQAEQQEGAVLRMSLRQPPASPTGEAANSFRGPLPGSPPKRLKSSAPAPQAAPGLVPHNMEQWAWLEGDAATHTTPSDAELRSIAAELGLDSWDSGGSAVTALQPGPLLSAPSFCGPLMSASLEPLCGDEQWLRVDSFNPWLPDALFDGGADGGALAQPAPLF